MTTAVDRCEEMPKAVDFHALSQSPFTSYSLARALSLDEAKSYLGNLLAPHDLTFIGQGKSLCLLHNVAKLNRINLHYIAYKPEADGVHVLAPQLEDNFLIQMPLAGTAELSQGKASYHICPGRVFLAEPRKPLLSRMSADYQQLILQVPVSILLQAVGAELQDTSPGSIHFDVETINGNPVPGILLGTVGAICQSLNKNDGLFDQPMVQRSFQMAIVSLILSLPNSLKERLEGSPDSPVPYYVRRTEAFMRAHLTDDIGLDDFIQVCGASRRTLHAGFRRHRNTTPMGLLKSMRLDAARDQLLQAKDHTNTITEVATSYGFYHLSNFARDFRAKFGRLPSELLRNACK